MESNDSPEIPDRGETSDIPGLPSGEDLRKPSQASINKEITMVTALSYSCICGLKKIPPPPLYMSVVTLIHKQWVHFTQSVLML